MTITEIDNGLIFKLTRDFNYLTATRINSLSKDITEVQIDLSRSKIVDSEALIILFEMSKAKKKVTVRNPPEVMKEVLDILGLSQLVDKGKLVFVNEVSNEE